MFSTVQECATTKAISFEMRIIFSQFSQAERSRDAERIIMAMLQLAIFEVGSSLIVQ